MDLGTFYREFQNPPQLASLTLDISSQSMADDLVTSFLLFKMSILKPIAKAGFCFCFFFICRTRFRRNWRCMRKTSMSLTRLWIRSSRWELLIWGSLKRLRLDTVVEGHMKPPDSHFCKYFVCQIWQFVRCLTRVALSVYSQLQFPYYFHHADSFPSQSSCPVHQCNSSKS